jgi:hypothetical protein
VKKKQISEKTRHLSRMTRERERERERETMKEGGW